MKTFSHTPMNAREFNPTVERLESRIAPAVVLSVLDLDLDGVMDDIRIGGDGGNNIVTVQDNGANTLTISIDADGNGDTVGKHDMAPTPFIFNGDSVALDVKLGGGADVFSYAVAGNYSASTRLLNVDLGPGKNTCTFSTGIVDVLNSSRISLDVAGRSAVDVVTLDFDEVLNSAVMVSLALGKGNDTSVVDFGNIDDNSSVDIGVDLGPGVNTLTAGFLHVGFGGRATMNLDVTGGVNKDTVTLNLHDDVGDGFTASAMNIRADLGAGNDVFAANLDYASPVFRVDDHSVASIAIKGGAGNDNLSVKGVPGAGVIRLDPDSHLAIELLGGAGNDVLTVNLSKADGLELNGEVRLRLVGGLGNDVLTAMLANSLNSVGNYDVAMLCGLGNDQATFQVINNGGTPTFGPTGKALLDGGLGTDILTNNSKPLSIATGFEQII